MALREPVDENDFFQEPERVFSVSLLRRPQGAPDRISCNHIKKVRYIQNKYSITNQREHIVMADIKIRIKKPLWCVETEGRVHDENDL